MAAKKYNALKVIVDDMLPLRGFLICPKCGRMLTGSASKGCKKNYYHYYHCSSTCGVRYNASKLNVDIVEEIKKYVRPLPKLQLYKEVIVSVFKAKTRIAHSDIKQLNSRLDEANRRLSKARELLLIGDIDAHDYRVIKGDCEERINRLETQLTASVTYTTNIEPLWDRAISNVSQLDVLYTEGTVTQKRKIISSMFPEKLTFDGFQYRTNRINEAINLMCLIDNEIKRKKKGKCLTNSNLYLQVTPWIQNSNHLLADLRLLFDLIAA
jgi:site-specific DNA recombinase